MLRKLKSLFVIEDSESTPSQERTTNMINIQSSHNVDKNIENITISNENENAPEIEDRIITTLIAQLELANMEGFDYMEFRKTLQTLNNVGMDEKTKILSAYALAKAEGATIDVIVNTANTYLDILSKEEKQFNTALQDQTKKNIDSKKEEHQKILNQININNQEIDQLKNKNELLLNDTKKLEEELTLDTTKITRTKNNFHASLNFLRKSIEEDITLLKKIISDK